MLINKNLLNKVAIIFAAFLLILIFIYQYGAFRSEERRIGQQLILTDLNGKLIHYDEALTMSARLFTMTGDVEWQTRYREIEPRYLQTLSQIKNLIPIKSSGKLDLASINLFELEHRAFELMRLNKLREARSILFSTEYLGQQNELKIGLSRLLADINLQLAELQAKRYAKAIQNIVLVGVLVLLILGGWFTFIRISENLQKQLDQLNGRRMEEALAAKTEIQKANTQLRRLTSHLQYIREDEKRELAYEIHERLAQQLTAIKINIDSGKANFTNASQGITESVSDQLNDLLHYFRNLATKVYPNMIRDLGLVEAMEFESKRIAAKMKIGVTFLSFEEEVDTGLSVSIVIYRTFQEKLKAAAANGATEISSILSIEDNQIVLSITDNAPNRNGSGEGLSLEELAIKERLHSINSSMKSSSSMNETNTVFYIPFAERKVECC
ncbi:sensor histidine kinase [Flaviaesturariibacter terrae]